MQAFSSYMCMCLECSMNLLFLIFLENTEHVMDIRSQVDDLETGDIKIMRHKLSNETRTLTNIAYSSKSVRPSEVIPMVS